MEGQERNTAQLKRIGAVMEQRWGLEGAVRKEESENVMGGLRIAPEKVRRRELCHLPPVSILVLFYLIELFYFL